MKTPEYEKIQIGNTNEQLEISRLYSHNMKTLNIKQKNSSTLLGICDQDNRFKSAVYIDNSFQGWPKKLKCQKQTKTNNFPIKNYKISSQKKISVKSELSNTPEFPLKFGFDPFKGKTKFFRLWGSWYSNRPPWTHGFNAKIGFEKYAPSPKKLPKNCPKSAFQTKPEKFDTFSPISQDSVHIFQNQFLPRNRESEF